MMTTPSRPDTDPYHLLDVDSLNSKLAGSTAVIEVQAVLLNVAMRELTGAARELAQARADLRQTATIKRQLFDRAVAAEAKAAGVTPTVWCRGCGFPLELRNAWMNDGCSCPSPRGVNHGLVDKKTCTCKECDPGNLGLARWTLWTEAVPAGEALPLKTWATMAETLIPALMTLVRCPLEHVPGFTCGSCQVLREARDLLLRKYVATPSPIVVRDRDQLTKEYVERNSGYPVMTEADVLQQQRAEKTSNADVPTPSDMAAMAAPPVKTIVVEKRETAYVARLKDDPTRWGVGPHPWAAIGDLVNMQPAVFGIVIEKADAVAPVPQGPALHPCRQCRKDTEGCCWCKDCGNGRGRCMGAFQTSGRAYPVPVGPA